MTDGTHTWIVKSVSLSDTSAYNPAPGAPGYYLVPGYLYLTIELDKIDDGDLVYVVTGIDSGGTITKISAPGGLKKVYVTDSQNNKYYALEVAQTYIIIPVEKDSSGFTLYVADLEPVEIGR